VAVVVVAMVILSEELRDELRVEDRYASVKGVLTYILFELIRSYLYQSPAKRTHKII